MCSFSNKKLSGALLLPEATFEVNRASFADSDDTAVRRVETKKPQVEACGALRQKPKQEQQTQRQSSTGPRNAQGARLVPQSVGKGRRGGVWQPRGELSRANSRFFDIERPPTG